MQIVNIFAKKTINKLVNYRSSLGEAKLNLNQCDIQNQHQDLHIIIIGTNLMKTLKRLNFRIFFFTISSFDCNINVTH